MVTEWYSSRSDRKFNDEDFTKKRIKMIKDVRNRLLSLALEFVY